jgi:hypothetical protein
MRGRSMAVRWSIVWFHRPGPEVGVDLAPPHGSVLSFVRRPPFIRWTGVSVPSPSRRALPRFPAPLLAGSQNRLERPASHTSNRVVTAPMIQ